MRNSNAIDQPLCHIKHTMNITWKQKISTKFNCIVMLSLLYKADKCCCFVISYYCWCEGVCAQSLVFFGYVCTYHVMWQFQFNTNLYRAYCAPRINSIRNHKLTKRHKKDRKEQGKLLVFVKWSLRFFCFLGRCRCSLCDFSIS